MNLDEFLQNLWSKIINHGLDQEWADRLISQKESAFPEAGPELKRMLQGGVKAQDLARIVREVRYNACFDILHEIEDLEVRNQKNLKKCITFALKNSAQEEFDENWAKQAMRFARKNPNAPFADSGLALKRILDSG